MHFEVVPLALVPKVAAPPAVAKKARPARIRRSRASNRKSRRTGSGG